MDASVYLYTTSPAIILMEFRYYRGEIQML
jgi:hypothetical protein